MEDTIPRKRARVIVHANIPNLTKKMLHKSLEMSRTTVFWVIRQFNATGPVTPQKENVAEKGFPTLGILNFEGKQKNFCREGKPFSEP